MNLLKLLAMADASLSFLEHAMPLIDEAAKRGEISVEDQANVRAKYEKVTSGNYLSSGPEGEIRPD